MICYGKFRKKKYISFSFLAVVIVKVKGKVIVKVVILCYFFLIVEFCEKTFPRLQSSTLPIDYPTS